LKRPFIHNLELLKYHYEKIVVKNTFWEL